MSLQTLTVVALTFALQTQRAPFAELPRDLAFLKPLKPTVSLVMEREQLLNEWRQAAKDLAAAQRRYLPQNEITKSLQRRVDELQRRAQIRPFSRDNRYILDFSVPRSTVEAALKSHLRRVVGSNLYFESGSFGAFEKGKVGGCKLIVTEPLLRHIG